jgi:superfamily II DNA or RNA helicase
MHYVPEFVHRFKVEAEKLKVKEPLFSRSTYQYEVQEGKKTYFPFLQFGDDAILADSFCTCKISEGLQGCPHLAAAYMAIFQGQEEPLHKRFATSLWNVLCDMASERNGYGTDCLKEKAGRYVCESEVGKPLFSVVAKTEGAKKRLKAMVTKRVVETEETSIKFSNLSTEEIAQYKMGRGSHLLRYELSFWSDLAKWLMFLSDGAYEVSFEGKELPNAVKIEFPELTIWFYVAEVHLPSIIPSLATIRSPLKVFDGNEEHFEKVSYDAHARVLHIQRAGAAMDDAVEGIPVGEWTFVPGKGFYRRASGGVTHSGIIEAGQIAEVLLHSERLLSKYLPIYPAPARYRLWLDEKATFHIELYVETPGDLNQAEAALFPPYAYVPGKGFFHLKDLLFEKVHTEVARAQVADFITHHRLWLHQFPGFETHLGSLEAHLTYSLTPNNELLFSAELNFPESVEGMVDLGEWVYIKGSGFYMKKESRGRFSIHPGLVLKQQEIGPFLSAHREELEQVHHFFASQPFITRAGLQLGLTDEGLLSVTPRIEYALGIEPSAVRLFGDFVYVEGLGFSEIPGNVRLPEKFREKVVIPSAQEASFFGYEFEMIKPSLLEIDPQLQRPEQLRLKIRKIQRDRRKRGGEWLVDLGYESEIGSVDAFSIWDGFYARKKYLFSKAGLLFLKEPRFQWLRQLPKRRLDRKKGMIRLNTLEWIRLTVFEEIHEPKGKDPEAEATRKLLEELKHFEPGRLLDISRLQANLRPYQETGLQWLWFLYCHGLSGLLCDDMGLGKTHQAMALLAAVMQEDPEKENKYLVVCPTSVIYHWQELLRRFLPELRVLTYYGVARSLDSFEGCDLVLTSYGILRTGRDELKTLPFQVAIYDEIQIAKNASSQTHQALKMMDAKMKLGLSGTPIENRLRELKALFDVVLPGYMPTDAIFRELFVGPIEKLHDEEKKRLLSKLIKPFILRRKKSEVLLDLPEKIEEIAYCDLSNDQKVLYRETALSLKSTLYSELKDETKPISYVHVFSALSRLKQICDHPALLEEGLETPFDRQSGKWDLFVELLEEALGSGQKVVVFSQYLGMLSIIEQHLRKKGIGFATIKGSTRDRSEQLKKFQNDPECSVFTASLLAAGVGIDLTVASIVIHYDRWWNPAKENQATDRVHRIGQNRGVQVFKLVTKHSIEEHIHALIERKKGLIEDIIGHDDGDQINYLSRDELIKIFEAMFKESEQ